MTEFLLVLIFLAVAANTIVVGRRAESIDYKLSELNKKLYDVLLRIENNTQRN